jgi:hypothetical protein
MSDVYHLSARVAVRCGAVDSGGIRSLPDTACATNATIPPSSVVPTPHGRALPARAVRRGATLFPRDGGRAYRRGRKAGPRGSALGGAALDTELVALRVRQRDRAGAVRLALVGNHGGSETDQPLHLFRPSPQGRMRSRWIPVLGSPAFPSGSYRKNRTSFPKCIGQPRRTKNRSTFVDAAREIAPQHPLLPRRVHRSSRMALGLTCTEMPMRSWPGT